MNIVVLGSGGWGTALAQVLCDNNHSVTLWSHQAEKAAQMTATRQNPLLAGVTLSESLRYTADYAALRSAELVVFATPSFAVRATAGAAKAYLRPGTILVSVSKGIERDTNLRMSEIIAQEVGEGCEVVALSGPSHAEEVGRRIPTGCVAAHPKAEVAKVVQDTFMAEYFRIYTSDDIVGVELAGALKNVVALSCGVIDGMGCGDNTKALLMTRAMAEMGRLGEKLGGRKETFSGLAGMGDLIVTCTSMHSRNRRAGILVGQGKSAQAAMEEVGAVVEGYYAADSVHQLAARAGVEMPICECAYQVLYHDHAIQDVVRQLMTRARKQEQD